jgi:Tol biopolymer transport system component
MGDVYRATDTRLGRDVALKLLPAALAADPDRSARFRREAQVLASLNHPNIAAIYGLEEEVIVLELVQGVTLDERIQSGALPVAESLEIARQIAEALEYAHEKGVVHRDLKPANVKLTPEGAVKVLDFGLAKIAGADGGAAGDATSSPTLTMRATQVGIIMGTAAYMSPEQAAAKPVDRRADIWSFGVLLWELLTGRRLFEAESVSHTLADVLRAPIDLNQLPADTPRAIRELIGRCLDRDIRTRLRDIGEARITIQRAQAGEPAGSAPAVPVAASTRPVAWIAAAGVFAVMAAGLSFIHFGEKPAPHPPMRLFLHTPPGQLFDGPEISPDGTKVLYLGKTPAGPAIFVRNLASAESVLIPGTENAMAPFWSPDARRVGFYSLSQRALKVTDLTSGTIQSITNAVSFVGGAWSPRGYIIFRQQGRMVRIPEGGGEPVPLLPADQETGRYPFLLPDGHHFLYLLFGETEGAGSIRLADAEKPGASSVVVQSSSSAAAYLPVPGGSRGYILFTRGKSLTAAPFDAGKLTVDGEPYTLGEIVPTEGISIRTFSASQTGLIGYLVGSRPDYELRLLDRSGKTASRIGPATRLMHAAVSADGRRVLHDSGGSVSDHDLWTFDLARSFQSRITAEGPGTQFAIWSADGSTVISEAHRNQNYGLYRRNPSPTAAEEKLVEGTRERIVPNQSIADRFLIYQTRSAATGNDLWLLPLQGERKPAPLIQTKFNEQHAQVSPDGRWLAYSSDETGETQVYVRAFTAATGQIGAERHQVSLGGGVHPRWSRDGRELFFVSRVPSMMVARPDPAAGWERSRPDELFPLPGYYLNNIQTPYDVTSDGKFVLSLLSGEPNLDFAILVNWLPPNQRLK